MQDEIKDAAEERMEKAINTLTDTLVTIRTGRANPHMLDRVRVDYYGVLTPLNQMANVAVPEARMITIQPFDPSQIKSIERAIVKADLGLNPSNDGQMIRLNIPQLTEERRKKLVRQARKEAEDCKVTIRNARRKAIQELKEAEKNSDITEDDLSDAEKDIQKLTDEQIKKVDEIIKAKEAEILEV